MRAPRRNGPAQAIAAAVYRFAISRTLYKRRLSGRSFLRRGLGVDKLWRNSARVEIVCAYRGSRYTLGAKSYVHAAAFSSAALINAPSLICIFFLLEINSHR